jgi:predicted ATPase
MMVLSRWAMPSVQSKAMDNDLRNPEALAFGRFVLYPARKLLVCDAHPVQLGSRAFDLLVTLVNHTGSVVSHRALVDAVWPCTVVEPNSLRVHVSALRRTLGAHGGAAHIVTVPGRGYRFEAAVTGRPPRPAIPASRTTVIGREHTVAELAANLATARLVTLAGPGGIGKSTVARAFATQHGGAGRDSVLCIDVAAVDSAAALPATVAAALGLPAAARILLILDNCEHLVQATALLAESILDSTDHIDIVATSRAPLYARGERILRVAPLAVPDADTPYDEEAALTWPAVRLFVERAMANTDGFALSAANWPAVVHVCRQLDGLPLALELAAARVESLGVAGLAARLDDSLGLLTHGQRHGLPRHAALRTTLDGSYRLLDPVERRILLRLSVFQASFSLASAEAVCACTDIAPAAVCDAVRALETKSLLAADAGDGPPRYRLLNTTRRYAMQQFCQAGERHAVAALHACDLLGQFACARRALGDCAIAAWRSTFGGATPDLFGALAWALGPGGDAMLAIDLCIAVPFQLIEAGMVDQYRRYVEQALEHVAAPALRLKEMRLLAAWTVAAAQIPVRPSERTAMCDRFARLLAAPCPDADRTLALSCMATALFANGDYRRIRALAASMVLHAQASGQRDAVTQQTVQMLAERWHVQGAHGMGRHPDAAAIALRVRDRPAPPGSAPVLGPIPPAVSMDIVLARTAWLCGFPDRALVIARRAVGASAGEHPYALCQALAQALVPVAVWRGDHALAVDAVTQLARHAKRHALAFWLQLAHSMARGLGVQGWPGLGADTVADNVMARDLLGALFPAMLDIATRMRVDAGDVGWCAPEVLRVGAEQDLALAGHCPDAEARLVRAGRLAQGQGALSWELRCALSAARLCERSGRHGQAHDRLAAVYAQFTEGFDTADLVDARAVLLRLRGASQ